MKIVSQQQNFQPGPMKRDFLAQNSAVLRAVSGKSAINSSAVFSRSDAKRRAYCELVGVRSFIGFNRMLCARFNGSAQCDAQRTQVHWDRLTRGLATGVLEPI
jgi:hypothetical protein